MYTTPNEVYEGQLLQFHINTKKAGNTVATLTGTNQFTDIRISGYITDMSPIDKEFRTREFTRDHVEIYVGNNPPAEDSQI